MAWATSETRGEGVGEGGQRDAPAPAGDPGADPAEGDGAPDAEAALPDGEGPHGVAALAEVGPRAGDHVVDPAADDAERHRPDRDVQHVAGRAAAGHASACSVSQTATTMPAMMHSA